MIIFFVVCIHLQLLDVIGVSYCMCYISSLSSGILLQIYTFMFVSWNGCFLAVVQFH
jgi:hypothetical protein